MSVRFAILLVLLALAVMAGTQTPAPELSPEEIQAAEQKLRLTLAGPREKAFLQVLIEVQIVRDETVDTTFVYDLMVRFDPERYRNPRVGIYPLSFEDQFILWGKRIAMYTRSTPWQSSRFYLHDIARGRQAWIFSEDARRLYSRPKVKKFHEVEAATDLRRMSRWLRLMRPESREIVIQRRQEELQNNPPNTP